MKDSHSETASWAIQQEIAGIEYIHAFCEKNCRAGAVLRTHDGRRRFWKGGPENLPTKEQLKAAKKAVKQFRECPSVHCPCCDNNYAMASSYMSVKKYGVCEGCWLYVSGVTDGVLVDRKPTLEESMAVDPNDIRQADAWVMRDALMQLRKET